MPYIRWVTCPKCAKNFYINEAILKENIDLHCPFCNIYFKYDED